MTQVKGMFWGIVLLGCAGNVAGSDDLTIDAAIGGAVGGAIGGAVGAQTGGRDGAIVGAGLGAAAGAAINTSEYADNDSGSGHHYDNDNGGHSDHGNAHPHGQKFCPPGQAKKGRC